MTPAAGGAGSNFDFGGSAAAAGVASGTRPGGVDSACKAISQTADNTRRPVDIIFALDNSGSMTEEAAWVQQNMNAFSQQIAMAAVDAHVIVISSYPGHGNGICIDAPLGSGGCAKSDTKLPGFLHVDQKVSSNDALQLVIDEYPSYRTALRPDALKHIVVVTDDESDLSAADAKSGIMALDPAQFSDAIYDGIFSYTDGSANDECAGHAAAAGEVYKTLVMQSNGVSGNLCLQDFKPVFDRLAQAVIGGAKLSCDWTLPTPPPGTTFVPSATNVRYTGSAAAPRTVPHMPSAAACDSAADGWAWFYDNEQNPSKVTMCPKACTAIQQDTGARIELEFGCPTVEAPVR